MLTQLRIASIVVVIAVASGCAGIKQYSTLEQPTDAFLKTYVGGTVLKIEKKESLPNAFGGADIYGGKRPAGAVELKYLGLGENGSLKLRVVSTDVQTNENWRRRLGRQGYATASSDAADFEHDKNTSFEMEGVVVHFVQATESSVTYRLSRQTAVK